MEAALWGFAGTIIGASVSILTTYLNNRNAFEVQKEAEKNRITAAKSEFQRNNCIELQNLFNDACRYTSLLIFQWESSNSNYHQTPDYKENEEKLRAATRNLIIHTQRIEDDEFREFLNKGRSKLQSALNSIEPKDANSIMIDFYNNFHAQINERLGIEIRSNY